MIIRNNKGKSVNIPNFLIQKLDSIEKLANGSVLGRFMNTPIKYLDAQFFKRFIYSFNKGGRISKATTFWGDEMKLLLPAGMDIFLLGAKTHDSEIRLSKFLALNLSSGDIFVDAGAHFGFYSLLAAFVMQREGLVVSFEASEQIYKISSENVQKNNLIKIYHNALTSDDNKQIEFNEFPILYSEYNTIHSEQFEKSSWIQKNRPNKILVNSARIDTVLPNEIANCKTLNADPKYFVKIDVEGAEFEVLKGCSKILEQTALKNKIYIVIEYWGEQKQPQHDHAVDFLTNYGFKAHLINQNGVLSPLDNLENVKNSENIVFF